MRNYCIAVAGLVFSASAFAQDETVGVEVSDEQTSSRSSIDTITVTATRRAESMQEIPVSVTAVEGDSLLAAGAKDTRNLTSLVPGYFGGRNQNLMHPTIRGVGSSGTSTGDEPNVAVYVNGIYQGDPYSAQIDLVEVERVEVLRGPQGTVFGRNATGGLINVITPDPSFETHGKLSARWGFLPETANSNENPNEYDFRGYLTGPLSETVAADIAVLYRGNDGYIADLFNGGETGDTRIASVRSNLLFQPQENIELILGVSYVDANEQTASAQPFEGNTAGAPFAGVIIPTEPWQASGNVAGRSDHDRLDLSLRTSFGLGPVDLETTTSFMRTRVMQFADSDASNILLGETFMNVRPEAFTQEVRFLSAHDGPLKWIAGAYVYRFTGDQPVTVISRDTPADPITPVLLEPEAETTSYSGFFEGVYSLSDRLDFTAGIRYTAESKKFRQSVNGFQLPFGTAEDNFDKFTYRFAVQYDLTDNTNIYASYGTGFKSGVFNTFGVSPNAVEPETIKSAEIGVKSEPTRWLRVNISGYYYEYDDLQVTARSADNSFVLQNAANAEGYGGEFELTAAPIEDLQLRIAAAYTHAEYTDFPAAQVFLPLPQGGNMVASADVSGNRLVRTPRYTIGAGGVYTFGLFGGEAYVSGNVFHSDEIFFDFLNIFGTDPYTLVSSEVGWTTPDERINFKFYGTNLANEAVAQQISPGPKGAYIIYERPRTIGVGVEYNF